MTSAETIQTSRNSQHEFVEELYRKHARDLWLTFYAGCNDADLAYDVTHEVFSRLLEQTIESVRKPLSWLRRVGRNILIDRARRNRCLGAVHPLADDFVFESDEPWQHTRHDERLRRLSEAMMELRDTDREVLRLKYWHEFSSIEIGQQLQMEPNAVDMRLTRARRRLARQMSRNRASRATQIRRAMTQPTNSKESK